MHLTRTREPRAGVPRPRRRSRNDSLAAFGFLAPNLGVTLVFLIFPLAASVFISFYSWDGVSQANPTGLENYSDLLNDAEFRRALLNTAIFVVASVPATVVLALAAAQFLVRLAYFKTIFRLALFIPYAMSGVVVALVWRWFFNGNYGVLNYALSLVGISGPDWLNDPSTMMLSVVIIAVWQQVGFNVVLFIVGLQEVPAELVMAARVDGANGWQVFRHVTLPMLSPITFFILLNSVFTAFQVFDTVYVLSSGEPNRPIRMAVQFIYDEAFTSFKLGGASAAAVIYIVIIGIFTGVLWFTRRFWVLGEDR
jgi:multiple sugar transport system permease protein